jgi:LPXTG-motif cell wall-anchored protein
MKQVKGHGFIRKNKAGKVVSGIVLGTAMLMASGVASADEVKPTEVKNNTELLSSPDGSKAKEANENNNVAENSNKETEKSPEQTKVDEQVNKIVSDAKAKGVDVTFEGETKVTPEQADEAVKKVEDKVNKVVEEHSKKVEEYNKKLAEVKTENEKIKKENQVIENSNKNAKAVLTKDSTAKEANGVYTQTLVGKSNANHTEDKKVNHKPMDLVALVDFSSSFQSKRTQALNTLKTLIQTNLTDEDGVMLQGYIFNKPESYAAHGSQLNFAKLRNADWETGFSTKLLSKKDALSVIDKWASVGAPGSANGTATFTAYFNEIAGAMGDFGYKTDEKDGDGFVKKFPFEDVYSSQPNKKKLVSVVQFTDGWAKTEAMDATFANWAKDNAKTFMTIVNRNNLSTDDNNDTYSIDSMKKLGHPNIYDMTGKKDDVVLKEILEQFKNTATETKTVQDTKSKGIITLTPDENVTLVSATLISPSGKKQALEVKNNKVSYTGDLTEKGDYKVEYSFKSNKNEKGQVVGKFDVETVTQENAKTTKQPTTSDSKTDKFDSTRTEKGKNLLDEPTAPENSKVEVEKLKVVKPVEKKPETPKPVEKKPETPKPQEPKKVLPQTGETASMALMLAGIGGLMLVGSSLKKKEN